MRTISIVLLASVVALAAGYVVPGFEAKYADKDFLIKQKSILELFQHVHQHEVHTTLYEDSKLFDIEKYYDHYTNVEAVKEFVYWYKHGLLEFDEIFTIQNEHHKDQVIALFHVFFYAKDWETFYKSIVWARFHCNEGMFIYALTVAMLHRPDCVGMELPAPYEVYPYYFFNSEVMSKAQQYKMQGFYGMKKVDDLYTVVIPSNYTGWYIHTNPEQKISYFTEDIGLNSYYFYFHADYPFWMSGKEFGLSKDRRGERFLFFHQQILARYYLERLSAGLGVIPEFSFYWPIKTGYYPNLRYYNGVFFPARDNYFHLYNDQTYYEVTLIEDYERRLRDAIDRGFIVLPDGKHVDITKPESIEYLGSLIQSNVDCEHTRFYKNFIGMAKILIGASVEHFDEHTVIPSVLEHFETSLRDPMFYQLYKRVMNYYWQFKNTLPHYTKEELIFPGLKIESVEMDKLVTYFDKFDADITNAVDVEVYDQKTMGTKKFGTIAHYQGEDFVIKARTYRLNHLPFSWKLNVVSDKVVKGVVRVYIGPKYDQYGSVYHVNENRENFFLLDTFPYDFVSGKNVITRDSTKFNYFNNDRTTFFELYKHVLSSIEGTTKFSLDQTEAHCGFPSRLMLPKGRVGGMPYQFFFIVSPYHAPAIEQYKGYNPVYSCGVGSGARYVDTLPFGYPFDRKIEEQFWFTPNMVYYDVNIFHKKETELNSPHYL